MARDQEPVSEAELEEFQKEMEKQGQELREALAEDLGDEPEDYRAGNAPVADGGEDG